MRLSVFAAAATSVLVQSTNAISAAQNASAAWQRAVSITAQMTIEEKANFTTGQGLLERCSGLTGSVPRLGIPEICLNDGPVGVRGTDGVSVFPAEVNAASTWDVNLIYQQAQAMGAEFRGKGINVALAPVAGGPLGRSPYDGRNWEGYGSDPYLHGISAYWAVKGIQSNGVIATPKHFIAYEQETYRFNGLVEGIAYPDHPTPANNTNLVQISSDLDDRTLRELYLWPFEEVLNAQPLSLMSSYNRVNGTSAVANPRLLTEILKEELDFGGFVVSDWFSVFIEGSTVTTANAGLDMEMPGGEGFWGDDLVTQVKNSTVKQSRVDDAVHRILYAYYTAGQDKGYPKPNYNVESYATNFSGIINERVNVQSNHSLIIKQVAQDSAVLLKNSATGGLPLSKGARLAIFGTDAGPRPGGVNYGQVNQYPSNSTNNGTTAMGFGSGTGHFPYLIDPLAAITNAAGINNWQVNSVLQDFPSDNNPQILAAYDQAIQVSDTCLVFAASQAGEAYDRQSLHFDNNGDQLIQYVASQCPNTILITHIPGPTNFEVAATNNNVTAILNAGYPGQESGSALLSLLDGSVTPSGKLVYTILKNNTDYIPVFKNFSVDPHVQFSEGLLTDYRAADALNLSVRYPFGFGLSYTTFTYSSLLLTPLNTTSIFPNIEGVNATNANATRLEALVKASVQVTNSGSHNGTEVAQLYVTFPKSSYSPITQLRGFSKSFIPIGQQKTVEFILRVKDLQVWNVTLQAWEIPVGEIVVSVGGSSRALHVSKGITIVDGVEEECDG